MGQPEGVRGRGQRVTVDGSHGAHRSVWRPLLWMLFCGSVTVLIFWGVARAGDVDQVQPGYVVVGFYLTGLAVLFLFAAFIFGLVALSRSLDRLFYRPNKDKV